jgi:NAD(P) transhydrogenase subunit alpha
VLSFLAMVFGAANVVGGYVVTDRMLQMFRRRPAAANAGSGSAAGAPGASGAPGAPGAPGTAGQG